MRDATIGSLVFTLTKMDDDTASHEIRETYYTKISDTQYIHHGCIQGDPDPDESEEEKRPRYINIEYPFGFEYKLIPSLPVFLFCESKFAEHFYRVSQESHR